MRTTRLPTTPVVATTRCQDPLGWGTARYTYTPGIFTPLWDIYLPPGIPTPPDTYTLQKGLGTRDTLAPLDRMTDRYLWKHYLPQLLRAVNMVRGGGGG